MASRQEPVWTRAESGSPSGSSSARSSVLGPRVAAEHLHRERRRGDQQAGGERVGRVRCPRLPRGDRRRRIGPERLERRRLGRRHGREVQRGDDAEAPAARAPQRPEQVGLLVLVAAHLAPVGQDDLGRAQRVGGQPVEAAEDPEPAAEGEPGDADGRAAPARDRHAVGVERVVDVAEQRARSDRRPPVANRHPVEERDVDQHAVRRRAAGEAVAAAAHRDGQPVGRGELEGGGDVLRSPAGDDRLGLDVSEAGEYRSHSAD